MPHGDALLSLRLKDAGLPRARRDHSILLATWNVRELGRRHAASGYSPEDAPDTLLEALPNEEVKAAVAFVDAFDEDGFRRTTAALRRYFPALK